MKKILYLINLLVIGAALLVSVNIAVAAPTAGSASSSAGVPGPCPSGQSGQCISLPNPLKSNDIFVIIGGVIKWVMGIVGSLTLLMFIWGGFMWLTSAGNPEHVKKGSDTMLWAAIGVFLVLASYIILSTFLNFLTGK